MEQSPLTATLLQSLTEANLVYQAEHAPESLALLADIFAEDLANENPADVARAFALHRKRSPRFPTPAHIIALLPECRMLPDLGALPEKPEGRHVQGMGNLVVLALRGDKTARHVLDNRETLAHGELEKIIQFLCGSGCGMLSRKKNGELNAKTGLHPEMRAHSPATPAAYADKKRH